MRRSTAPPRSPPWPRRRPATDGSSSAPTTRPSPISSSTAACRARSPRPTSTPAPRAAADFKPSGSVPPFAEALAAIRGGTTYFNLHTAANPGGEIRGNLTGTAEALEATLEGAQEAPAVATAATGNGLAVISSDGKSVGYAVTYGGLSGAPAAAHPPTRA